jgi:hypothetical protein
MYAPPARPAGKRSGADGRRAGPDGRAGSSLVGDHGADGAGDEGLQARRLAGSQARATAPSTRAQMPREGTLRSARRLVRRCCGGAARVQALEIDGRTVAPPPSRGMCLLLASWRSSVSRTLARRSCRDCGPTYCSARPNAARCRAAGLPSREEDRCMVCLRLRVVFDPVDLLCSHPTWQMEG